MMTLALSVILKQVVVGLQHDKIPFDVLKFVPWQKLVPQQSRRHHISAFFASVGAPKFCRTRGRISTLNKSVNMPPRFQICFQEIRNHSK